MHMTMDAHPSATPQPDPPGLLRLMAMDAQDLAVISAHVQGAEVAHADMAYVPRQRRFAMLLDRVDWLASEPTRCRTGLHFEFVTGVAKTGLGETGRQSLTSILFHVTDAPAGLVTLVFEGGAAIRLTVECLEAQMRDLGPRWVAEMPAAPFVNSVESA